MTEACIVPFSLLAALQSSLIVLLQVPLKNSSNFWYKTGVLGGIYRLYWPVLAV